MLKLSRLCVIITLTLMFAVHLPRFAAKIFIEKKEKPYILYSSTDKTFMLSQSNGKGDRIYSDENGNSYSRMEYEKKLPMVYWRDLSAWNVLPESIDGIPVTPKEIRMNRQSTVIRPSTINAPRIDLYPLYESESDFSTLSDPREMFRIGDAMEFINASENTINKELSETFTRALREKGFRFPARYFAGNPVTRKPFDEGYFVEDSTGALFHIRMIKGAPFVAATGIAPEDGIRYIDFKEDVRREYYGLMVTGSGQAHLITCDNYKTVRLPVDNYDPDTMMLVLQCDLLKRTITVSGPDTVRCIVTDLNYNVTDTYTHNRKKTGKKELREALFPFSIKLKGNSKFALFELNFSKKGIPLLVTCVLALAAFLKTRRLNLKDHAGDLLIVGATGICGLAAVLITGSNRFYFNE